MNKNFLQRMGVPPRYNFGYNYVHEKTILKRKNGKYLSFKSVKRLILNLHAILFNNKDKEIIEKALNEYCKNHHEEFDHMTEFKIGMIRHHLERQSIRHEDIRREWANEK